MKQKDKFTKPAKFSKQPVATDNTCSDISCSDISSGILPRFEADFLVDSPFYKHGFDDAKTKLTEMAVNALCVDEQKNTCSVKPPTAPLRAFKQ